MANCCGDTLCETDRPPHRGGGGWPCGWLLAAWDVFGTGTRGPDLLVAAVMAGLALQGGWQVIRHARAELKTVRATPAPRSFKVASRHKPVA
ncbi:hypothetical protein D3C71_950590 [compost metagenome]